MDPELAKAVRQMLAAQANAKKAGVVLAPADLDAFIREETGGKYSLAHAQKLVQSLVADHGNAVASGLEGFTGNFGDELVGLLPDALGGGEGGKEQMRLRTDLFHQQHPVADVALGVGGALASTPLLPELKAAEAAGTGARIARASGIGALYGGAAGAGSGEDAASRLTHGALGTAAGAVLGTALPAVVAGAKTIFEPLERANARLTEAIMQSGGFGAVRKSLSDVVAAGKGELAHLADLSPRLRGAADFAANNSEDAFSRIREAVDARAAGTPQRMLDDYRGAAGDAHGPTRMQQLKDALSGWAGEAYGKIRGMENQFDKKAVSETLNHPDLQGAWKYARRAGDLATPEGKALDEFFKLLSSTDPEVRAAARKSIVEEGGIPSASERPVSFNDLQQFKRILDARVKKAYAAGDGELAKQYSLVRDKVKQIIVDKVPEYTATDAEYARRKGLIQAVQDGMDAFHKNDITALKNKVASLSPEQLEQFRHGLASEQIVALQGKGTGSAAVREMTADKLAQQARLKVVFGNEETFDKFMNQAKTEKQFDALKETVGNSATARRLAAREHDPLNDVTRNMHYSLLRRVEHAIGRRVAGAIQHKTAGEMTGPLLTKGEDAISKLLRELEKDRSPLVKSWMTDQLPAAIGSLFH